MAKVSSAVVKSLVDNYTREELVAWQKAATAALMANLPRVELTGSSFESGSSSGEFIGGAPQQVVELTTAAIESIDSAAQRNPRQAIGDFSARPVGW